jgi:3-oxoacyl-[acyl-carrier protein] reductase
MNDLQGRRILVTSASSGIWEAAARAFARNGARVAVQYNRSQADARAVVNTIARADGRAFPVRSDLTKRGETKGVEIDAVEELGGLDILINNAGSLIRRSPFSDIDDALIDELFDLNVPAVGDLGVAVREARGAGLLSPLGK